jgi:hypothetical protein
VASYGELWRDVEIFGTCGELWRVLATGGGFLRVVAGYGELWRFERILASCGKV